MDENGIIGGIAHWEEHTCIRFQKTYNTSQPHLRFIVGSGCWSYVGKVSETGQEVSIGYGCNSVSKKLKLL